MAQNTATVLNPNPSPPTNFGFVGASQPSPPNYTKNTYNDPKNWSAVNPKDFPPPAYDDGTGGVLQTFATNVAALASGSAATAGGTEGTYPGTGTNYANPNNVGATPASSSVAHEGAGTEVTVLAPGNINYSYVGGATLDMSRSASCGPVLTPGTLPQPNQLAGSSLSPATNPALTTIAPTTAVSGASGSDTITCTGTNFTRQSVVYRDGIRMVTTYVSATSLTAVVTKRATAGASTITVITGGVVTTAGQTLTYS